jgi:hypothetical protein
MRGDESFSHAAIIDLTDDASRAGVTAGVLCRYHRSVPSARRFPHRGRRGNRSVLHRARRHQAGAGLRLLRGQPGRRTTGKLLTGDEARRIAANTPSCRSCCADGRRKARRDEIAGAHFTTVRAMCA